MNVSETDSTTHSHLSATVPSSVDWLSSVTRGTNSFNFYCSGHGIGLERFVLSYRDFEKTVRTECHLHREHKRLPPFVQVNVAALGGSGLNFGQGR